MTTYLPRQLTDDQYEDYIRETKAGGLPVTVGVRGTLGVAKYLRAGDVVLGRRIARVIHASESSVEVEFTDGSTHRWGDGLVYVTKIVPEEFASTSHAVDAVIAKYA